MNSRRPNSVFRVVSGVLLFAAFVMGVNYATSGLVARALTSVAVPAQSVIASASAAVASPFTSSVEAQEARASYEALRAEVLRLADVEVQNAQLRAMVRALELLTPEDGVYTENTIAIPVYARTGSMPYGTLTIARTEGAYAVGATVYGNNGIAIGIVTEVSARSAQVQLLSSVGESFAVIIEDAEGTATPLTVEGYGHGNFIAQAPRDATITKGSTVYSTRVQGAPIAVVAALEVAPSDPVQTVRMQVPFSIDALRFVRVQTAL